jgi:arsenite-transporting ATPase
LQYSPGIEEYALLHAYEHISKQYAAKTDHIIFDMPPTALSLKFFNLPHLSLRWLQKLSDLRNEIIIKRELITSVKMGTKDFETDKILKNLESQVKRYKQLHSAFQNSNQTNIRLVVNPDPLSLKESLEIIKNLKSIDLNISHIILNKYSDKDKQILKSFSKYHISHLPVFDKDPVGLNNLSEFCHFLSL